MADSKLSALSSVSTVGATDLLYVVDDQGGSGYFSRKITVSDFTQSVDHNSLDNLDAGDVHTQYVLADGRSSGQTVYGGVANNEALRLQGTSVDDIGANAGEVVLNSGVHINTTNGVAVVLDNGAGGPMLARLGTDSTAAYGTFTVYNAGTAKLEFDASTGVLLVVGSVDLQPGADGETRLTMLAGTEPADSALETQLYCETYVGTPCLFVKTGTGYDSIRLGKGEVSAKTLISTDTAAAPLTVSSSLPVSNLNADLLDGYQVQYLAASDIKGCYISNNGTDPDNDVNISKGVAWAQNVSDDTGLMYNIGTIVKRLDAAWSEGTNQGGLISGAKSPSTVYYVYLIGKHAELEADREVDAIFSTSLSPTLPGDYTLYRRLGWVITDSSGNIRTFQHVDQLHLWTSPELIIDTTTLGTTRTSYTWVDVNTGGPHTIMARVYIYNATDDASVIFTSGSESDVAPSSTAATLASVGTVAGKGMYHTVILKAQGNQIYARASHANTTLRVAHLGTFIHHRNRYAWDY